MQGLGPGDQGPVVVSECRQSTGTGDNTPMLDDDVMAVDPVRYLEHVHRCERTDLGLDFHERSDTARLVRSELQIDGIFHPRRVVCQVGEGVPDLHLRLVDMS